MPDVPHGSHGVAVQTPCGLEITAKRGAALRIVHIGRDCRRRVQNALGLDPNRNNFDIAHRLTQRDPDEIIIQLRSLIEMISFLSRDVEVPETKREQGRVVEMGSWEDLVPFRIRSSEE